MTLVESYRELDCYGQALVLAVVDLERARAERQADEETIRLHDAARRSARRGGARLRRPEDSRLGDGDEQTTAPVEAAAPMADIPAQVEPVAAEVAAPSALTTADLIRGGGDPTSEAEGGAIPRSRLTRSTDLPAGLRRRSIDLYDMPVSAGVGEFLTDANRIEDIVIPDDPRTAEADFALRINGDSMEPRYHSGDILLVQSADTVEEGELGIFILDGSGFFKRYGGDHLISLNPKYPPIPLKDFQSVACCGRVVGKLKKK